MRLTRNAKPTLNLLDNAVTVNSPGKTDMPESTALLLPFVGLIVIVSIVVRRWLEFLNLPAILGYITLGIFIRFLNDCWDFLDENISNNIYFLSNVGIVVLLFRVGLESNIVQLIAQIRRASFIWTGDVLVSFATGFLFANKLLGFELVPSLVTAAALSATSLGVTAAVWRDAGALDSETGALLTDVAELDDISGVLLLALILALIPMLRAGDPINIVQVGSTTIVLLSKFILFCGLCFLFARYLERPLIAWFLRLPPRPTGIVVVTGLGFIISGIAGILGFSLAVGALFAGLAFSRDPAEHRIDKGLEYLFLLFSPFFFLGLGLDVDIHLLGQGAVVGSGLVLAAIVGKLAGAGLPTWLVTDRRTALLIGLSMIPRAEITMVVMQQARYLGDWAVPPELFGGMIVVSLLTCLVIPLVLQVLLRRFPH